MNEQIKELEEALKRLLESASNYVQDDVWYIALMMDIQNAAFVLGDDKLYAWTAEVLGEDD